MALGADVELSFGASVDDLGGSGGLFAFVPGTAFLRFGVGVVVLGGANVLGLRVSGVSMR